jgi:hypothetical protein
MPRRLFEGKRRNSRDTMSTLTSGEVIVIRLPAHRCGIQNEGEIYVTYDKSYGRRGDSGVKSALGDSKVIVTQSPAFYPSDYNLLNKFLHRRVISYEVFKTSSSSVRKERVTCQAR